jgi:RNA polymerase sigma-70 factor (ECF subfamily)
MTQSESIAAPKTLSPAKSEPAPQRIDEKLFEAYQNGEVSAFHELVNRHQGPLYRFCLRALGQSEAAADATQEVFLRVVKHAPNWERKAKFTTWLYTIARNHCIDEKRKGRFRKTESLDQPLDAEASGGEERIDQVVSEAPGADAVLEARRLRNAVDAGLAALPNAQSEVFCLRQYGGLSFPEIAEALQVGENTVKSRMRYALETIRKTLIEKGFREHDTS